MLSSECLQSVEPEIKFKVTFRAKVAVGLEFLLFKVRVETLIMIETIQSEDLVNQIHYYK